MIIKFTEQSLVSLQESLEFISKEVSLEKLIEIRDQLLNATDIFDTRQEPKKMKG